MPDWNAPIRQQLAALKLAPTREAEIVEELSQHADDRYRELQTGGVADAEARRVVLQELTGHQLLANELRSVERTNVPEPVVLGAGDRLLGGLGQDVSYGLRALRNSPGFT